MSDDDEKREQHRGSDSGAWLHSRERTDRRGDSAESADRKTVLHRLPASRRGAECHLRNDSPGDADAAPDISAQGQATEALVRPSAARIRVVEDEQDRVAGIYRAYDREQAIHRKWSRRNPGNQFLEAAHAAAFAALLAEEDVLPLSGKRILDIGCGTGDLLRTLCKQGAVPAECHGVDILPDRIERAREASAGIEFHLCDARTTPFDAGSFDLVFTNMVFSSVLALTIAREIAGEIRRVLAPEGAVVWHDHRYPNPWNKHVRRYTRRDLRDLFPGFAIRAVPVAPVPPVVRRLGRVTRWVAPAFDAVPLLRVDYLAVMRRAQR